MFGTLADFTTGLFACALGHAVGEKGAEKISDWVSSRLRDPSRRLPEALAEAYRRAWRTVEYALVGDLPLLGAFARADERALCKEIAAFLRGGTGLPRMDDEQRRRCLAELNLARERGLLDVGDWLGQQDGRDRLANEAASFGGRFADPAALVDDATRAVAALSEMLDGSGLRDLADLVNQGRPPLLASAFAYFLRHGLAENKALADETALARLERLADLDRRVESLRQSLREVLDVLRTRDAAPPDRRAQEAFAARQADADAFLAAWRAFAEALAGVVAPRRSSPDAEVADHAATLAHHLARHEKALDAARRQLRHDLERPVVTLAMTGTTSSGKSCLVNLLCGAELMPVAVLEMSAGVVTIEHGGDRRLTIHATAGADWTCGTWDGVSDEQIRERLTEVMDRYNARRGEEDEPACPLVDLTYPTRLGMRREALGLPEGFALRVLDLPGLKFVGDDGNARVIRERAGQALCMVLYNSSETNPHVQATLLKQVVEQVKELGGSPARMMFVLNRIDVFRQDRTGARNEEEFAHKTTRAIRKALAEALPEYEEEAAQIEPLKLSTLPALYAQRAAERPNPERLDALRRLDHDFRNLIPDDVLDEMPRRLSDWKEEQARRVARAVLGTSYADDFYARLRDHVQGHLPDLVLPQAVWAFHNAGGHAAVQWALVTARSGLNSSRQRYAEECRAIGQTAAELGELREHAAARLRQPFEEVRAGLEKIDLSDEAGVRRAVDVLRASMQRLAKTEPYDRLSANALAPLYTWREDLAAVVRALLSAIDAALAEGKPLSGDVVEQLPARSRRALAAAVEALTKAGYDPHTARHGGTVRAEDDAGRRRLRDVNAAVEALAKALSPAMEDAVHRASRREVARIFAAMQRLFAHHKDDVAGRARAIAPGIGLEMPEADLDLVERDLTTEYGYAVGVEISSGQEKRQTGTERVRTGTRTRRVKTGERAWWNPMRWLAGKDTYETYEEPTFADRPTFTLVSYEQATLPAFRALAEGWSKQTRQRDPELIQKFLAWLLSQAGNVSASIEGFQQELLARYRAELDRAHAAAKKLEEDEVALWTPLLQKAEASAEAYARFTRLKGEG